MQQENPMQISSENLEKKHGREMVFFYFLLPLCGVVIIITIILLFIFFTGTHTSSKQKAISEKAQTSSENSLLGKYANPSNPTVTPLVTPYQQFAQNDLTAAANAYCNALVKQDWQTLYSLTSSVGYSESDFANLLSQQAQQKGAISSCPIIEAPKLGSNPAGIEYFTVKQNVTYNLNGQLSTMPETNVFELQNGKWLFWFSNNGITPTATPMASQY